MIRIFLNSTYCFIVSTLFDEVFDMYSFSCHFFLQTAQLPFAFNQSLNQSRLLTKCPCSIMMTFRYKKVIDMQLHNLRLFHLDMLDQILFFDNSLPTVFKWYISFLPSSRLLHLPSILHINYNLLLVFE